MTKLFDLLPGWLWALMVTAALAWGWWQYNDKRTLQVELARVDTALAKQKIAAGNKLLQETERANNAERMLFISIQEREAEDAKNQQASRAALDDLRSIGRLHDPAATGRRCSSDKPQAANTTAAARSARNSAEANGKLSANLTELLFTEAETNDRINDAYTACRADSLNVRRIIDEYNTKGLP